MLWDLITEPRFMAKIFLDPLVVRGEPDSDIIDIWQRSDGVGSYLEPAVFLGDVAKRHAIFLFYDFVQRWQVY